MKRTQTLLNTQQLFVEAFLGKQQHNNHHKKAKHRAPKPEVISSVAFRRTASERGRGRVRQHGRRADSRDLTDRSNRGVVRKQSLRVPRGKQYEEYGGEWRRRRWRVVRRVFWSSPCRALAVWRNTLVNVVISAPNLK
uniref:Uncharacterized protein n=1 Tax=Oryza punctata TaxID=4537 RepID=A0A0E0LZN6_ORYPU